VSVIIATAVRIIYASVRFIKRSHAVKQR